MYELFTRTPLPPPMDYQIAAPLIDKVTFLPCRNLTYRLWRVLQSPLFGLCYFVPCVCNLCFRGGRKLNSALQLLLWSAIFKMQFYRSALLRLESLETAGCYDLIQIYKRMLP